MEINITFFVQLFFILFLFFCLSKKIISPIFNIINKRDNCIEKISDRIKYSTNIYNKQILYIEDINKTIYKYKKKISKTIDIEILSIKNFIFKESKNYNVFFFDNYKNFINLRFEKEKDKMENFSEIISNDIVNKIIYL